MVWGRLVHHLFRSPMAEEVIYTPQGQEPVRITVLIGPRDVDAEVGIILAQQDVVIVEARQEDLPWRPRPRVETFQRGEVTYRVSSNPAPGVENMTWTFSAYAE